MSHVREHWWGMSSRFNDETEKVEDGISRYTMPRGWWVRLRWVGVGLHYRNISKSGYRPLFIERHGIDRTLAVRFGPHLFTWLRRR